MGFGEAISSGFRKYADFSGRALRSEYWWWTLFTWIVYSVVGSIWGVSLVSSMVGDGDGVGAVGGFLWFVVSIGLLIPSLAVFVRRMHDTGRSGWWWFIGLIPLVGFIVLLVFLVEEGSPSANQYGEPPARTA